MPPTQLNNKTQLREFPTFNDMVWEQLQDTKTEVRETRKELTARMDKLEGDIKTTRQELNSRMDKLESDVKTTRQELNARMDRIEQRIDNLDAKLDDTRKAFDAKLDETRKAFDAKLDETRKELSNKIDALHNEIKSSTGHISIANISTVGIAIGVLYSLIFK
ncbi:MAG: hypothetical protein IJ774_01720 [Selenomonadaceae bacterium]|nr:hypothetical protein [Selenomonadaceae bacterium]